MKPMKLFNRIAIAASLILVGGVSIYKFAQWYYCLPPLTRSLLPGACLTEDEATYRNIGNGEFHAVATNCDTLAKEEFVEVVAYRNDSASMLPKWLRKRTMVFVYDPGRSTSELPWLEAKSSNRIRIAVPEVSSVSHQQTSWDGNVLEYDIDKVDYPANLPVTK